MYTINENAGSLQAVLVLSRNLSTEITVQITDKEGTANSEYTTYYYEYYNVELTVKCF